jgi:hypothetical protein
MSHLMRNLPWQHAAAAAVSEVPGNELSHKAGHSCHMLIGGFQVTWDSLYNLNRSYCLCQFTWPLHSIVVILAQLIMAWFMWQDSDNRYSLIKKVLCDGVCSTVAHAHCSYCAYNRDGGMSCHVIQPRSLPPSLPSVRCQDKWHRQ